MAVVLPLIDFKFELLYNDLVTPLAEFAKILGCKFALIKFMNALWKACTAFGPEVK